MHKLLLFAGLLIGALSFSLAGTTGKIAGEIKDAQTGEPIIGANVTIEGTTFGAATNTDGYYVILNIPPGTYTVVASAIGYQRKVIGGVSVSVDLTSKIDVQMTSTVLESGEEIVITAERPVIKKDLTSAESRVDANTIKAIPVQEVAEVLTLQAGVTADKGGGIHIRGGRTSEVAYWVDGVSISDQFDRSQAVQIDNSAVQELQVISGTFNAEYGQAMSGIVNIVTKEGGQSLHGNISAYTGSYVTNDGSTNAGRIFLFDGSTPPDVLGDKPFYNLDKVRPFDNKNIEGSLSGPVFDLPLSFYATGRYYKSEGWLYGNHVLNNDGTLDLNTVRVTPQPNGTALLTIGDNPRSMNGRTRYSGQAKLTWQVSGSMKLNVSGIGSRIDFKDFNHDYMLMPDADVNKYDRNYTISALWTHSLSPASFYTVNLSFLSKTFKEYLYEDPFDPRYIVDNIANPLLSQKGLDEFNRYGTNNHRFFRTTETRSGKIDYTNQLSSLHLLKAGVEARLHQLYFKDFNLYYSEPSPGVYKPALPPTPISNPDYDENTNKPVEFSAYIQDKLEYRDMIVNVGLRFDYFDARSEVLTNEAIHDPNIYNLQTAPAKALAQTLTFDQLRSRWFRKTKPDYLVSPRFGISYPITDRGVLHFSYGHFLQIPTFDKLYQNSTYKVPTATGFIDKTYGNPELRSEKTVMYELGLQQQLTDALSFDVTGFYRDTRDWVTASPAIYVGETEEGSSYSYTTYINKDYANSRGITVTVNKRPSGLFQFNFSYTFQTAEGLNSNPDDARAAQKDNKEPAQSLAPLEWDQTHTANLTLGVGEAENWGAFVLGRFGSGLPYTPVLNQSEGQGQDVNSVVRANSRRKPATYTVDLRLFKNIRLDPITLSFFVKVFNLFDRRNEIDVFGETGRATATPEQVSAGNVGGGNRVNTVAEYLVRPDYYSEPREIQFGIEINY